MIGSVGDGKTERRDEGEMDRCFPIQEAILHDNDD
jgi:hypothetical protein